MTGENFKRINRCGAIATLREEVEKARITFWDYLKDNGCDDKAARLEKEIDAAEYKLYCAEYEDARRRTWK